jgi:ABC-2 type transport system ATP-binding protein
VTLPVSEGPVAIKASGVRKSFRIPVHKIDSLKERATHPLARNEYRQLQALRDVSFDVRRGEFFGIVGRNGSGKSTLLKILASIYRQDAGRIRMAGRVAPFIELGVGFNPEFSARENVVLNGVMMGLSRREAASRLDEVLDFAELREFVDLKLKNYSSGMQVRLAFAVMIQSDAEVLLIDEVLAVGDAAFQRKCEASFEEMRDAGRTIVLVTHDMSAVQGYCHRAMLLEQGNLEFIGDPEEAGRRYLQINFEQVSDEVAGRGDVGYPDVHARLVEASLGDRSGRPVESVPEGEPIRLEATLEARKDMESPRFSVLCAKADGTTVFEAEPALTPETGGPASLTEGERVRISGSISNPLRPGRYLLKCVVERRHERMGRALQPVHLVEFDVPGAEQPLVPLISVDSDLRTSTDGGAE